MAGWKRTAPGFWEHWGLSRAEIHRPLGRADWLVSLRHGGGFVGHFPTLREAKAAARAAHYTRKRLAASRRRRSRAFWSRFWRDNPCGASDPAST